MCNLIRQKVCSSIKKHEVEYKKLELTIIVTYSHFWKAVDDLFSNFFFLALLLSLRSGLSDVL